MFQAGGCVGGCRWDGPGVLLFEVLVGCLHIFASSQIVSRCSRRLREVLVDEAVLRPFGKLQEGVVVCPAVVQDPHLGEGDVYYGDGGPHEVYGVNGAFGVMVEVPAEDRQGSFLQAFVVSEYGVVRGTEEKLEVVPQAHVHVGGHAHLVEYPVQACVAGPLCGLEADFGNFTDFRRMVVAHAVKEEGGVSGVGRFHLVSYGVSIVGPCLLDGASGYGGWPAPVCCPCLGDGACGRLEGGGGVCQVECLEAYGGVQDPGEVACQALLG